MRDNRPVTDHEYVVPEGWVLVSKTDLDGNITYCNKAFSEISGFSENELLGQPHNIVRHPDVPQRIFADYWEKITAGKSWHGILKNRRKNGDYYWVDAHVTPLLENGKRIGYVSLRYKPTPGQIAKTEKYFSSVRGGKLLPVFPNMPDKNYVGELQQRLAEKIVAQEDYLARKEEEQRIAACYMNKLIALDKLRDPAVLFYLKPAENFSGDLIAISRTPDCRLHLLLADSTGHGLSAALAATPMIHPFYSMTAKGFSISAMAKEINTKVWQSLPVNHFVAAILVSIDAVGQMVEVWSGGCPPPLILDSRGECAHRFKPRHLAMGILPPHQFDASVEYFSYDDNEYSVLMFSDGVVELENEKGEQFGLRHLLEAARVADAATRWQNINSAIKVYCGDKLSANDDIALMLAQCEFRGKVAPRGALPERQTREPAPGKVVWQFALTLAMHQIKKLDVVPLLLDIVQQIEKDKERGGEIFMILSELFDNALDHGLLQLDSSLKHHEDGMEKYFAERATRLANAGDGQIQLNLEKALNADGGACLRIRVQDSGNGFDYQLMDTQIAADTQRHGRGIALVYNLCRTVQFLGNGSGVMVEFNLPDESK
ncbi:MAG: PAS domain S-box protein [Gallionellaceae bacterium]|nr:MAG: PAS domain S-box protein [Gallionellaceae bacterium]